MTPKIRITLRQVLLALVCLLHGVVATAAESVISKATVEQMFRMSKADWEAHTRRVTGSGWEIQLKPIATGTALIMLNPSLGMGFSTQPLYADENSPPTRVTLGTFSPTGKVPDLAASQKDVERDAQRDLGPQYRVTARQVKLSPSWEGIEITITPASDGAK